MQLKKTKKTNYKSEYMDTLSTLMNDNSHLKSFRYFLDTAFVWMDQEYRKKEAPQVVVLGPGVPEELLWAAGAKPYWILGGSLGACAWADDLLPRDTDPVSRSVMGFLHEREGLDMSETLFIVPVYCDSMRKIAYLLKEEGKNVLAVDFPPEKDHPQSLEKWNRQMLEMVETVKTHVHGKVTRASLRDAVKMTFRIRIVVKEFLELAEEYPEMVSDAARIFIQNSYYYSRDPGEWCHAMKELNQEIEALGMKEMQGKEMQRKSDRPGILLMGSPVYFPNYKIPFLIQEIGLSIEENVDVAAMKFYGFPLLRGGGKTKEMMIGQIAAQWYLKDGSPSYVRNTALYDYVCGLLKRKNIEGVVYHILKGQIEYDFELPYYEKLFESHGIPVFRLETDYQYQDVEQLRIRMEAFAEMLKHNRMKKGA